MSSHTSYGWEHIPNSSSLTISSPDTPSTANSCRLPGVNPLLKYFIEFDLGAVGVDLDQVARDYGISRENYEKESDYCSALIGWLRSWALMPKEEVLRYVILTRTIPCYPEINLHMITAVPLKLDLMGSYYGLTRDNFLSQDEFRMAILNQIDNFWTTTSGTILRGYNKIVGVHIDSACREFSLKRNDFESEEDYGISIAGWLRNCDSQFDKCAIYKYFR